MTMTAGNLITKISEAYQSYMQSVVDGKSSEWKERNKDAVSGGVLSVCIRQAWYFYRHRDVEEPKFNSLELRRIFAGFMQERLLHAVMVSRSDLLECTYIHDLQGFPPVTQQVELGGVLLSSTTDFVLEYGRDSKKYFIPIELKTTNVIDWDTFTYWDMHVKQLMLWIHYAKMNNLSIPFGLIRYERMHSGSFKHVVIHVDRKSDGGLTDLVAFDYKTEKTKMDKLVKDIVSHIKSDTLPDMPNDVPLFKCRSCPFRNLCSLDRKD